MSTIFRLFLGAMLCSSIIACQDSSSDAIAGVAGNVGNTNITDPGCLDSNYAARNPSICGRVNTGITNTCFNPSNCNLTVPDDGCTCAPGQTSFVLNNQIVCDGQGIISGSSTRLSVGFYYSDSDIYGTEKEFYAELEHFFDNGRENIVTNCVDNGLTPRPEAVLCSTDFDCQSVLGSQSRCTFTDSNNPNIGFCTQ